MSTRSSSFDVINLPWTVVAPKSGVDAALYTAGSATLLEVKGSVAMTDNVVELLALRNSAAHAPLIARHAYSGLPSIRDTGITVGLVLEFLARGGTPEQIAANIKVITVDDVRRCLWLSSAIFSGRVQDWPPEQLNALLEAELDSAAWQDLAAEAWRRDTDTPEEDEAWKDL